MKHPGSVSHEDFWKRVSRFERALPPSTHDPVWVQDAYDVLVAGVRPTARAVFRGVSRQTIYTAIRKWEAGA